MIEVGSLPVVRGIAVAGAAIGGETLLLMAGLLVLGKVTIHAIRGEAGILPVAMALFTIGRPVPSLKGKTVVIESGSLPAVR